MDKKVRKVVEDFKKETGLEETSENFSAFNQLREDILFLIPEPVGTNDECNCSCDTCDNCEY